MPELNQTERPLTSNERIIESAQKAMEKKTAEVATMKLESGQNPNDILKGLISTLQKDSASEQLSQGLDALSKTQVPIKGSRIGGGQAFVNLLAGKGFNPEQPRTEELGIDKATQILNRLLETQQEQRLRGQEDRRLRQEKLTNIRNFGGVVPESDIESYKNDLGVDFDATVEAYGLQARVDKETGKRTYVIPPDEILRTKAQSQKVSDAEINYLGDIVDANETMKEVISGLAELGITEENINKVGKFSFAEVLGGDLGPFSIPAKFNLSGQYAKDPKYTMLKAKLERAFQKYRKVVTGAQASNKELVMLRPLIATFSQRPGVFFSVANDLISESDRVFNDRVNLMESAGRDVSKIKEFQKNKQVAQPTKAKKSEKYSRSVSDLGLDPNRYEIVGEE